MEERRERKKKILRDFKCINQSNLAERTPGGRGGAAHMAFPDFTERFTIYWYTILVLRVRHRGRLLSGVYVPCIYRMPCVEYRRRLGCMLLCACSMCDVNCSIAITSHRLLILRVRRKIKDPRVSFRRAHVKEPIGIGKQKLFWNNSVETPPTVGDWSVRLGRNKTVAVGFPASAKATRIAHGKILHWNNEV